MADPYDPFGLGKRDPQRDPANGPSVPNMGGIPQTPMSPNANAGPFTPPPSTSPDQGGRPTEGAVGASPFTPPPNVTAPTAPPQTEGSQPPASEQPQSQQGVTINIGHPGQSSTGQQPPSQPGSPVPGTSGGVGPSAPPQTVPGITAPLKLNRLPTQQEMLFGPQGSTIETPLGTMTRGADGNWQMEPNEQGIQRYKAAKVKAIQDFGQHPYSSDPNAPLPPVEPGQIAYNPFTDTYSGPGA